MFSSKPEPNPELEMAITKALEALGDYAPAEEGYHQTLTKIERLYALRNSDAPKQVSPDTLAIVVGNLLGIALIVTHERAAMITSKALNFVIKASR